MPLERKALETIRRRALMGMKGVAVEMSNRSKVLATRHTDNGTRRNSITQTIVGRHVLWGISVSAAPHAPYLERGFEPHWVPARYVGVWMKRHGIPKPGKRGRVRKAAGMYVGGPGSTLQSAPGGASGLVPAGFGSRKRVRKTWSTKGGTSPYLKAKKVGNPVLQPVAAQVKTFAKTAFLRAYRNAR